MIPVKKKRMAWTAKWQGQGNVVDGGAFFFAVPKSAF